MKVAERGPCGTAELSCGWRPLPSRDPISELVVYYSEVSCQELLVWAQAKLPASSYGGTISPMSGDAKPMAPQPHTNQPFPEALGDLLRAQQADPIGIISLRALFSQIEGYSYDALRKMVRGELTLQPAAIEAMAAALGVPPEYFLEYRAWQLQEGLKRHPELADKVYDMLMASFELLDERKGFMSPPVPSRPRSRHRKQRPAEA